MYPIDHVFERSRVYERLYHHQQLVINQVVHYLNGVKVRMLHHVSIQIIVTHDMHQ